MERLEIGGREVVLWGDPGAAALLVPPVDDHDLATLESEASAIAAQAPGAPFRLAAFRAADWNGELSPWPAPPVFGDTPFGGGARATLDWVTRALLPALDGGTRRVCVGGYSLAGLFALYAAWESDAFVGAAGVSPSVWFPGWLDFVRARAPRTKRIYLSLGDREERTRHPVMRGVGDSIRAMDAGLKGTEDVASILEWNPGNHFREPDLRTARGFAWLLRVMND